MILSQNVLISEVDVMGKVVDLTILCRIKANLNGRMMTNTRLSGKVGAHTKEVLDLIEEEVILILEVVFMVIVTNVVRKGIDLLNVYLLEMGKIIEMLLFKRTLRVHQVHLRLHKI